MEVHDIETLCNTENSTTHIWRIANFSNFFNGSIKFVLDRPFIESQCFYSPTTPSGDQRLKCFLWLCPKGINSKCDESTIGIVLFVECCNFFKKSAYSFTCRLAWVSNDNEYNVRMLVGMCSTHCVELNWLMLELYKFYNKMCSV